MRVVYRGFSYTVRVALGLKSHSGWAALVVLGAHDGGRLVVLERRRVALVAQPDSAAARQPYHAAEGLESREARAVVLRGIEDAGRTALLEMRAAVSRLREAGHVIAACAVLDGDPMPDWSVDEILAVHFRMHKAEGELFRGVLVRAAEACGLKVLRVPEKTLPPAPKALAALGKAAGSPWGRDQKLAAHAALLALTRA